MSGHPGHLSPQQNEALSQFKILVSDLRGQPETSDAFYLRWLRARSFDVDKAVNMLRKHLDWRAENNVDAVLQWTPPEVIQKYFTGGFLGEDRDGHPVYYDFTGYLDFRGLMRTSVNEEDVLKHMIQIGEQASIVFNEFTQRKGKAIENCTVIVNVDSLSYQRHFHWRCINLARQILQGFTDNYPERIKQIFIVNAPSIFPVGYNLVKPFIDEKTRDKIVLLGGDWQEQLTQYIAPDQIPQAYGGTRCDPDPKCSAYLRWGGDVPEEYFMSNIIENKKADMESATVGRGSTFQLELEVELTGTAISWEYMTMSYDIGFGIFRKPEGMKNRKLHAGDMIMVRSTQRTNCHETPESGVYHCSRPGTYVLRFDNTYSWTHSKELYYLVRVLPPDTDICAPQESEENGDIFVDCRDC